MSRKTGYQPKTRNSYQRKRKSVVLLAAEGKNKTETQYFKSIPSPDHVIRFAPGNYTDPVNMVYALRKEYEELELDAELGDAAFCLVDSDVDPAKDRQLEKADTEAGNRIQVVVSSPCFGGSGRSLEIRQKQLSGMQNCLNDSAWTKGWSGIRWHLHHPRKSIKL